MLHLNLANVKIMQARNTNETKNRFRRLFQQVIKQPFNFQSSSLKYNNEVK